VLVGVVHARVDERLLDAITFDRDGGLIRVLLDDREQVAEQPLLDRRQLGAVDRRLRGRVLDAVDLDARRRDQRRPAARAIARLRAAVPGFRGLAVQPLGLGFGLLLRNRRPSSCRSE
jgi:hypothetical protein